MKAKDRNGKRRVRGLAQSAGAGLRAGVLALAAVIAASGVLTGHPPPALAAGTPSTGSPLHFLEPLAPASGDPALFDASLLDDLIVTVCRIEANGCEELKTLTATSSQSERLRIGTEAGASYYLANWDTAKLKLPPFTYRISVSVEGLTLGSIDVGPDAYRSFARTWPIRFRVDRDPAIHLLILRADGRSASQVADVLRREFGLGPDETRNLLAADPDPYSDEEIDLAIRGVFQDAVVPPTTKIADEDTRAALTAFDVATGRMTFSNATPVVTSLEIGDVLVGEPSEAAPTGYLRVVTAIVKPKRGPIVLETRQATFNEAVRQGTLDAAAELTPADLDRVETGPGVTAAEQGSRFATAGFGALDIGDGYNFHETIDVTIEGQASGSGVTGQGTVRIQGDVRFNAGYNIGFGVEDCFDELPPVCVDRFEARIGVDAATNLTVTGNFTGHMEKEYVLSTHYFKPIVFFIGPIPVVLVPIVKAIAGATGDARLDFTFETRMASRLEFGAKWTDPDDGGKGWENLSNDMTPTGTGDGDLRATMELRAYAKADAKLLLYGVVGPGLAARAGAGADVQFPGNPLWKVFAHARGEINFAVDLGGILKLAEHIADLPEFTFQVAQAENQPPECGARTTPIPVAIGEEIYLGPRTDGSISGGYFDCNDPEGEQVTYRGFEGATEIDIENARWDAAGTHVVEVRATDESNVTRTFTLTIEVINTPPLLSLAAGTTTVPASVQLFVTASAYDVEDDDFLPCVNLDWTATGGTLTEGLDNRTCTAVIVFDQLGTQTVKVVATDAQGKSTEKTLTVTVTAAPANPAPQIQLGSFEVVAPTGPKTNCDTLSGGFCEPRYNCPSGFFCRVPDEAILYNQAVGDYGVPLILSIAASDPNGDPLTVTWSCTAGQTSYAVTDNGDGTFSCDPYSASYSIPILIQARVSDGTTTVSSEVRTFRMLDRVG